MLRLRLKAHPGAGALIFPVPGCIQRIVAAYRLHSYRSSSVTRTLYEYPLAHRGPTENVLDAAIWMSTAGWL